MGADRRRWIALAWGLVRIATDVASSARAGLGTREIPFPEVGHLATRTDR